jgi:hypothetical protein
MLSIDERCLTVRGLPRLQQQRITLGSDRRGLERDHPPETEPTAADRPLRDQHPHVDRVEGRVAAVAALIGILDERVRVRHRLPRPTDPVDAAVRRGLGLPRGARRLARHRVLPQEAAHRLVLVLGVLGGRHLHGRRFRPGFVRVLASRWLFGGCGRRFWRGSRCGHRHARHRWLRPANSEAGEHGNHRHDSCYVSLIHTPAPARPWTCRRCATGQAEATSVERAESPARAAIVRSST